MKKLLLMFMTFAGVGLAQNPTICNLTGRQTTGQILIASNNNKTCHWGSAAGTGDVLGPATNSANFFPQWNGANSKTLLNGVAGSGSGNVCLTTNCVMVTPNLGTPSALVLTNATGLPTAGMLDASVTLAKMANLANGTRICRTTAGTGVPEACTAAQEAALLIGQTLFTLTTTGTSGAATYSGGTLNIPQYTGGGGSGCVPSGTASQVLVDSGSGTCLSRSATVDSSGNGTFNSLTTSGSASGANLFNGLTSGGVALTVNDVAGTAIAYVLPSTNGAANQFLMDNGSQTCPTLIAGMPATCHALLFVGSTGTGDVVRATSPTLVTPALGTPSGIVLTNATGLPSAQVPAVPLTAGTSITLSENHRYFVCTDTCTVTVPAPTAGIEYCVYNDNNVSTVITLAAIGSSARYENTARTAYGTAGTGTFVSGGAAADKVCIVGRDSTHYSTLAYNGTWTAN